MGTAAPLVLLMGPTAAGKSTLALALAERIDGEIISVDSAQVYRGMDIGTAKPVPELRRRVPHHLIDIRDPADSYSAGEFVRDALAAIAQIRARDRQPLLVGGTALYLRALYRGLALLPPACGSIRRELDAHAQTHGWSVLHAELESIDPAAAARIAAHDTQRIQRALEVYRLTGVPLSQWQGTTQGAREQFRWLRYALVPEQGVDARAELRARLEARFGRMLDAGLVEEVARLYARGDLTTQHASIRAVGYRQLWQMFAADMSLAEARGRAVIASAQLAKRQLTWLRREETLTLLPMNSVGIIEALAADILAAARA
ncbi:MAG TPA: tRNA (adenosine(37)-N6)-dimethylallyltransferase MiaA [Casimicrobiaceae bacterium]